MTTSLSTDHLALLVERKLQALTLLKRLAEQQLALIEAGDMEMLMKLLTAKQTLLSQLHDLDRQLDPFRAQDPEKRLWRTPDDRRRCQEQADRCGELLAEVMQLEKQGEGRMVQRRDSAAARLQGVHSAAEASHAYAASPVGPASDFDLRDEG